MKMTCSYALWLMKISMFNSWWQLLSLLSLISWSLSLSSLAKSLSSSAATEAATLLSSLSTLCKRYLHEYFLNQNSEISVSLSVFISELGKKIHLTLNGYMPLSKTMTPNFYPISGAFAWFKNKWACFNVKIIFLGLPILIKDKTVVKLIFISCISTLVRRCLSIAAAFHWIEINGFLSRKNILHKIMFLQFIFLTALKHPDLCDLK